MEARRKRAQRAESPDKARTRRRPRADRGVRTYILPEDNEAQILAKVSAARRGGATG